MPEIKAINLGFTDYKIAWDLQRRLVELRIAGTVNDLLLLTEHRHVFTIGKSGDDNHLLANEEELRVTEAEVYHCDRGGDITYHGPGQLVVYPILDLHCYYLDIHRYLRDLEEVIIRTLAEFGIESARDTALTGVWVGNDKIAAIGVKVSRWITMHGFALNVNTDLAYFDRIIPCGIFHKGVSSMERRLGYKPALEDVANVVIRQFGSVFKARVVEENAEQVSSLLRNLPTENAECQQAVNR
jgi:lipoyl(octanoyl) transferase